MQVKTHDLAGHLAGSLAPVYLISGDETLLVEEACDAVIAKARAEGFTERSVHHVESGFRWHELALDGASMSLFAERKLIDLRLPPNKFDKEGSAALRDWLGAPPEDVLLLLRTARLQPRQRSAAWFKALESEGVVVLAWPVSAQQLPRWLGKRLQRHAHRDTEGRRARPSNRR